MRRLSQQQGSYIFKLNQLTTFYSVTDTSIKPYAADTVYDLFVLCNIRKSPFINEFLTLPPCGSPDKLGAQGS